MAIEQGIWKIGDKPTKLKTITLESEQQLEEQIVADISILNPNWLLIGRQVRTDFDKYIDLLAIDASGSVIIIELKRDKTPRDVVAQALDYASWVVEIDDSKLVDIYYDYSTKHTLSEQSLDRAFDSKFGVSFKDVNYDGSHQMVIVASALDASSERIINYLNDKAKIPVNAVFFNVFEDGTNQYLSRAWMIAPEETQERVISKSTKEPWNGEFYVSFGHGKERHWNDALKYGYISAGHGRWYSNTLNMLEIGDRVWVKIPQTGFVAVGKVIGEISRAENYEFPKYENKTLLELDTVGDYSSFKNLDDDDAEYLIPVEWIKAVPLAQAFNETGLFGNQNSVCKPQTPKWSHTVDRVKTHFAI
ncbi:hypothetical protein GCM10009128_01900 [Psychrosphaera haliotis]|uniref:hypothetical protein n=1 Tax=Psychrosphaera haliotis TaxID=555083 RepID=UPI0031D7348A